MIFPFLIHFVVLFLFSGSFDANWFVLLHFFDIIKKFVFSFKVVDLFFIFQELLVEILLIFQLFLHLFDDFAH